MILRTLRLSFADRPDFDLAFEATAENAGADPRELLAARADRAGRISLGDRDWCRIDDVIDATIVEPARLHGPTWERGLRDEDVATALDESFEQPE